MRLVASSNSNDVERSVAIGLLVERLVLTRMVCRELIDRTNEEFSRWRTDTALGFLMQWISLLPDCANAWRASDGIESMVVPDDCQHLLEEIRDGARVCDASIGRYAVRLDERYDAYRRRTECLLEKAWNCGVPSICVLVITPT